jgi:hypothetical protein
MQTKIRKNFGRGQPRLFQPLWDALPPVPGTGRTMPMPMPHARKIASGRVLIGVGLLVD